MNATRQKLRTSLGTFFVFFVAGIMIVAMLVNTIVQYRADKASDLNALSMQAESLSKLLAEISIVPILSYDYVTLDNYAQDAARQKHVTYVAVLSTNSGVITGHTNDPSVLQSQGLSVSDSKLQNLMHSQNILQARTRIIFEGRTLGYLQLGMDKSHIEAQSKKHLFDAFALSGITAVIIGLILIVAFRRKILSRLNALTDGAEKISNFEFDVVLDDRGGDELAALAGSFNHMKEELKLAIEDREKALGEVESQNLTLEERVAERSKELESLNKALSHQALHDSLTGLPNRALVLDRLQSAMLRGKRSKKNAAILMLDLDKFKDINDTLGHPVGDRLLQAIGRRLKGAIREEDTIGRLGGDEFAVVLPDTNLEKVQLVASKILSIFGPEFIIDDYKLSISASLGIAMYPEHGEDQATLLKKSDVAMYAAKNRENRIVVYDPEKDKHSPAKLEMFTALRKAIDDDLLEAAYQPIVSLKTGMVSSIEALARWRYLKQDISPEYFIPMAEEAGLGQQFTKLMLARVIKQAAEWQARNIELPTSVNLSMRNIDELNLPILISNLLSQNGLDARLLRIEITESELMANPEYLMSLIQHPELEGIQYSIDDFGTGYSSLSYLKKLSVHQVKIDRSFVSEIDVSSDDYAIAKAIIDLSHSLGLEVVAEGVEREAALHTLMELECDYVQGYLFSEALDAESLIASIMGINEQAGVMLRNYKRKMA